MINNNLYLPSNKKFGFFFSAVFFILFIYLVYNYYYKASFLSLSISSILIYFSITNPNHLYRLNLLWNKLGVLLGFFVSPLILGMIYFGLFTPIAVLMRLFGRDELSLKKNNKLSFWLIIDESKNRKDYTKQF